jgi:hypothetical protein
MDSPADFFGVLEPVVTGRAGLRYVADLLRLELAEFSLATGHDAAPRAALLESSALTGR